MANDDPRIDPFAAADIEESIRRLLRDLGNPEPPLRLDDVRAIQKLDLTYYSKSDLNLLDEMAHRVTLAGHKITTSARRMLDVVTKAGLKALIVPEQRKIYIDKDVVDKKRRFIQAHEITHDLLPWHKSLLLGDNEDSLSPRCHQEMEAEANYGARHLIFLGDRFASEVRDHQPEWKALQKLSKDYGNTITTTLWQTVQCWDNTVPMFGMIGRHPYHADIGVRAGAADVAYFIRSDCFMEKFGHVTDAETYSAMCSYVRRNRRGPVGDGMCLFTDANGDSCEFHLTSFCNGYDLLTMGRFIRPYRRVVGF